MSTTTQANPVQGSAVYPLGSRVNERGHLEVGGCDVIDVVAEFGTPAYIYAEDELRYAIEAGVGHVILDSFDEIERLDAMLDRDQNVLIRVTPGIRAETH